MSAQADRSTTTRRYTTLNWLLWACELLVVVLVLLLLVAVTLPLVYFFFSEEGVEPVAGLIFGLMMAAILVGVLVTLIRWFLRGRKLPLDARRLHRGSVAIGAFAFIFMDVIGTGYVTRQFGIDAMREGMSVVMLVAVLVAWVFHRLLFANLKQWTGLVDDRTFDERYEPARHYVAAVALLILNVFNMHFLISMEEVGEQSLLLVGGPLVGVIILYKITVTITAWRIRRKIAVAEPPAAAEGGAA